jgi:NCS1 family nucleobase:cation symporter-1
VPTILLTLFASVGDFGWFIGCALGFAIFALLERARPMIPQLDPSEPGVSVGTRA